MNNQMTLISSLLLLVCNISLSQAEEDAGRTMQQTRMQAMNDQGRALYKELNENGGSGNATQNRYRKGYGSGSGKQNRYRKGNGSMDQSRQNNSSFGSGYGSRQGGGGRGR